MIFDVNYHQITVYRKPADCDWWHAPWGTKSCYYVKSVQSWKDNNGHVEGAIVENGSSTGTTSRCEGGAPVRLKCDRDSTLTPSPVAAVEVGELLGRSTEIGEQSAQGLRALDT